MQTKWTPECNVCTGCGAVVTDIDTGFSPAVQEMTHDCGGHRMGAANCSGQENQTMQAIVTKAADWRTGEPVKVRIRRNATDTVLMIRKSNPAGELRVGDRIEVKREPNNPYPVFVQHVAG